MSRVVVSLAYASKDMNISSAAARTHTRGVSKPESLGLFRGGKIVFPLEYQVEGYS